MARNVKARVTAVLDYGSVEPYENKSVDAMVKMYGVSLYVTIALQPQLGSPLKKSVVKYNVQCTSFIIII